MWLNNISIIFHQSLSIVPQAAAPASIYGWLGYMNGTMQFLKGNIPIRRDTSVRPNPWNLVEPIDNHTTPS
jgi:hypothetical protein